jgi:predicted GNAT family acetyltransferase
MIVIDHDRSTQEFTADVDGHRAVLNYLLADDVMTITHTGVAPAIRGRAIAAELMRSALQVAKTAGWRVNPVCSYAAAYMRRHPDGDGKQHIDDLLDEALEESFPASDSPSVGGSS